MEESVGDFLKGEYLHSIDSKGRLIIPSKLREELGESFVVTKGVDCCLSVYPQKSWEVLEEKIKALPISQGRKMQRFFFSSAIDCSLDSQSRILISAVLREYAGLTKDVTVIGVSDRVEIWDTKAWNDYNDSVSSDDILEAMEEIGF